MIRIVTCEDLDQDLLLLEHDALSGPRRWRAQAHLRRCPRCQERREHFARVSCLMAGAIREPDLRPWVSPEAGRQAAAGAAYRRRVPFGQPGALARAAAFVSPMQSEAAWQRMARSPAFVAALALLATAAAVASILYQAKILPLAPSAATVTPSNAMEECGFPQSPASIFAEQNKSACVSCHASEPEKKSAGYAGHSAARPHKAPIPPR